MEKIIFKRNISNIEREIYRKYPYTKEIDFNKDIDITKSGKFILKENQFLEFEFQPKEEVKASDFIEIIGKKEIDSMGNIQVLPILDQQNQHPRKVSIFLINQNFVKEKYDTFYIDFEVNNNSNFTIIFNNLYNFNLMKKLKDKQIVLGMKEFLSNKRISFKYNFYKDVFSGCKCIANRIDKYYISKELGGKKVRFLVNVKDEYIIINNKKIKVNNREIFNEELKFITVGCEAEISNSSQINTTINSIYLGNSYGYIYLKPLNINSCEKRPVIYMIYHGQPSIEVYYNNNWIDVNDNFKLNPEKEIQLRIRMESGDIMYKLFILK